MCAGFHDSKGRLQPYPSVKWAVQRSDAIKAAMHELGVKQPEYLWLLVKQAHPDVTRTSGRPRKERDGAEAQAVANQILGNERVVFPQGLAEVVYRTRKDTFRGTHPGITLWYSRQFHYSIELLQRQVFIDGATCDPKAIVTAMRAIGKRGAVTPIQCPLSSKGVRFRQSFDFVWRRDASVLAS